MIILFGVWCIKVLKLGWQLGTHPHTHTHTHNHTHTHSHSHTHTHTLTGEVYLQANQGKEESEWYGQGQGGRLGNEI